MRVIGIVAVQLLVSAVITASLMPVLVLAVPMVHQRASLGMGVSAGIFMGCFGLLALSWPWRGK
jgi:hypothetical protein